jgi:hygromycin-B 7''-O-kinase
MQLPEISTLQDYRTLDLKSAIFVEAARDILHSLKFPVNSISHTTDGSSPVVLIDDNYVVKFFAPIFSDAFEMEKSALEFLSDIQSASPHLLGAGAAGSWSYVVMSRLRGKSLKELWPNLTDDERASACFAVGQKLRTIHDHSIPQGSFRGLMPWPEFIRAQALACADRHQELGLGNDLIIQIPKFLAGTRLDVDQPRCFLHTEVMRDHVFISNFGKELSVTGFVDFEPSMIGAPEYDFASVGIFLSSGSPQALRSFFLGYGNLQSVDREFKRRIMAYALLHKYSNLKWYLEFMPRADSLEELAEKWWAV